MIYLYWGAGLVIVLLSVIAGYYHVLLYKRNNARELAEKVLGEQLVSRRKQNIESINIIARAVLSDQVSHTEASIRINALVQTLVLDDDVAESLSVFRQLAEATSHIPILERWKALSKKEKAAFEQERAGIEAKFKRFILVAAKKLAEEGILSR